MNSYKLKDKVALITGATSGIGRETAKLFANEGAKVIVTGRNEKRGHDVVAEIDASGGQAEFFATDVTKQDTINSLIKYVKCKYGRLDILFNNAGVFVTAALEEITEEIWDSVYAANVKSMMLMTQQFEGMLRENHGTILNNASIGGLDGHTIGRKEYIYASSKAAAIKFSKLCALNMAPEVRVNCICPGITDTPIYTNRDFSRFKGIPMERVASPEEIAKAALFLVSDDASYITGVTLPVDGGASLR